MTDINNADTEFKQQIGGTIMSNAKHTPGQHDIGTCPVCISELYAGQPQALRGRLNRLSNRLSHTQGFDTSSARDICVAADMAGVHDVLVAALQLVSDDAEQFNVLTWRAVKAVRAALIEAEKIISRRAK